MVDDLPAVVCLTAVDVVVVLVAGLAAVVVVVFVVVVALAAGLVCALIATKKNIPVIPSKIFFMYCILSLSTVAGYLNELFIERIIVALAFDGLHFFLNLFSHFHFECSDFLFQHFAVS